MATGVEINRTSIGVSPELSAEVLQKTQEQSAIMTLARQINLPGKGAEVPVILGDAEAEWVSETGVKPVKTPSLSKKVMTAYKLAVIIPFSNEFRRDLPGLYNQIVQRIPLALAKQFDATVIGAVAKPGSNFDNFANAEKQEIGTATYAGLVAADTDIAANGGILNGFALAPQGKGVLLAATDNNLRPLFINSVAEGAIPQILGAPVILSKGMYDADTDVVGVAGDWTQAVWGSVEGLKLDYSSDASLVTGESGAETMINLFQQNMFAVRAEIEIGFRADVDCFNLLTATPVSE